MFVSVGKAWKTERVALSRMRGVMVLGLGGGWGVF